MANPVAGGIKQRLSMFLRESRQTSTNLTLALYRKTAGLSNPTLPQLHFVYTVCLFVLVCVLVCLSLWELNVLWRAERLRESNKQKCYMHSFPLIGQISMSTDH